MEKDQKQGDKPQGGQPQSGPPQSAQAAASKAQEQLKEQAEKAQEQLKEQAKKAQEYQQQLSDAQAKYLTKYQGAWAAYYEKTEVAYNEYQDAVRDIREGERKAALQAPKAEEGSTPAQNLEAFKAARLKSVHQANEVYVKLRGAEQKYNQKLASFWDDVFSSVAEAVEDFWKWIIGWWEEPPVEGGGGGGGRFRALADPAWRAAFDPAAAAYYTGWNYGPKLY